MEASTQSMLRTWPIYLDTLIRKRVKLWGSFSCQILHFPLPTVPNPLLVLLPSHDDRLDSITSGPLLMARLFKMVSVFRGGEMPSYSVDGLPLYDREESHS